MKTTLTALPLFLLSSLGVADQPPKLVLQIVVDQLRGDLIFKHKDEFGPNGFNYLIEHSIDYHNAHHAHANTTTCVGHTTISTGSIPALHGIIDNEWYDRKSQKIVYCMLDKNAKILPTLHTKTPIEGRSAKLIKASTLSDELVLSQKGRAFAVSLKDRSAISLAGHAGMPYWFDKTNGGFVTSSYYSEKYPKWVDAWNKNYVPENYDWTLSRPISSYKNANNKVFRHDYGSFGQNFPHHISHSPSPKYFKSLSRSPKADQLTEDFAEHLINEEKIGSSTNKTDYLAISFSAVDAIGHQFSPNSIEAEDNLLALDQTIGKLLQTIDKQVGLKNTLIVLSADHGVSDSPAYLKSHRFSEIKPINIPLIEQRIRSLIQEQYKLPPETLMSVTPPFVYLDHKLIFDKQVDLTKVSQFIADNLTNQPGIYRAYPLPVSTLEKDWLSAKVNRMAYSYRSGDVYLVQPPYQSLGANNDDRISHSGPWQYDSYVPMLFVNPKFNHTLIVRKVYTMDIAPTLAMLLQIKLPSATVGKPLEEVINQYYAKSHTS